MGVAFESGRTTLEGGEGTYINVLVAAQKVLGNVHRKNVGQQFPVVRLQVFHVLLLLGGLQLPNEIQPIRGLRLVAVEYQRYHKDHHEYGVLHGGQEATTTGHKDGREEKENRKLIPRSLGVNQRVERMED